MLTALQTVYYIRNMFVKNWGVAVNSQQHYAASGVETAPLATTDCGSGCKNSLLRWQPPQSFDDVRGWAAAAIALVISTGVTTTTRAVLSTREEEWGERRVSHKWRSVHERARNTPAARSIQRYFLKFRAVQLLILPPLMLQLKFSMAFSPSAAAAVMMDYTAKLPFTLWVGSHRHTAIPRKPLPCRRSTVIIISLTRRGSPVSPREGCACLSSCGRCCREAESLLETNVRLRFTVGLNWNGESVSLVVSSINIIIISDSAGSGRALTSDVTDVTLVHVVVGREEGTTVFCCVECRGFGRMQIYIYLN